MSNIVKQIIFIALIASILSGCNKPVKQGGCYFNDTYSVAMKVLEVKEYGAFVEVINRPGSTQLNCPITKKSNFYISWDVLERNYKWLYPVDCEAYERIPTND